MNRLLVQSDRGNYGPIEIKSSLVFLQMSPMTKTLALEPIVVRVHLYGKAGEKFLTAI